MAKKFMSFLLAIAMVLTIAPVSVIAEDDELSYLTYEINDGEVTITDCDTSIRGNVVIPDTIEGYPVVSIGRYAFENCTRLHNVSLPSSVTTIGYGAFIDCTSLGNITIPDEVTKISDWAFGGCSSLDMVTIPNGVTYIGYALFNGCTSLASVTIGSSVTSIGDYAFKDCTSLASVTIPDSVTIIGNNAFYNTAYYNNSDNWEDGVLYIGNHLIEANTDITEYTIKDGTLTIANYAFSSCTNLERITITDSVTSIGACAFEYCTSLTNAIIGDSVTSIGAFAFSGCTSLESITISDSSVTSIGNKAFSNCAKLDNVSLPNSVTSIGVSAFEDCTSLASITIHDNVTSIGESAFYNTAYYEDSANWENGVLYIGNHLIDTEFRILYDYDVRTGTITIADKAFVDSRIENVAIPGSVAGIGTQAFYRCSGLESITVSEDNEYYSSDEYGVLFNKDQTELIQYPIGNSRTEYTISNSVTIIGDYAFGDYYGYSSLVNVEIGNSVESIGISAFERCLSLENITIPNGVISLGSDAFCGCKGLEWVTIGNGVTSIDDGTFGYCTSLESVTIGNSVTSIGWHAFKECTNLGNITIPEGVTSIGQYAFNGCTSLENITIPDSVMSIEHDAFYNTAYYNNSENWEDGVLYIDNHLIKANTDITECTIKDGIITIAEDAFYVYGGVSLESITIPNSVTNIGDRAFYICSSLDNVYYAGSEDEWNSIEIASDYNWSLTSANIHYNCTDPENHYISEVTAPTCTEQGYTTYTCPCGYSYDADYVDALGGTHNYVAGDVIAPTCTAKGYTVYTCSLCGDAYNRDYVDMTAHFDEDSDGQCDTCSIYMSELLISSNTAKVGETLTITVSASNMIGLESADLLLEFDEEYLEYASVAECEDANFVFYGYLYDSGIVKASVVYTNHAENDTGLFEVTFNVLQSGNTDVKVYSRSWAGSNTPEEVSVTISLADEDGFLDEPTTAEPTTVEPTTEEPTTIEPSTEELTTEEPTTVAPETTTKAPETTTKAPEITTKAPETTTSVPETTTVAEETTTSEPVTEEPTTEEVATDLSVVADSEIKVDNENKYAEITAGTSIADVLAQFINEKVVIFSADNEVLAEDVLVGTGCIIKVMNGEDVVSEYTVIVPCDVDGNGKATAADARLALRSAAKLDTLTGVYSIAANIDGNDKITAADARMILRKSAKLEG